MKGNRNKNNSIASDPSQNKKSKNLFYLPSSQNKKRFQDEGQNVSENQINSAKNICTRVAFCCNGCFISCLLNSQ